MKTSTIVFPIRENNGILEVLLGMKLRGFGRGKWNGYGGKVVEGETPSIAAVRELQEESGLIVAREDDLDEVAIIYFYEEDNLVFRCYVYLTRRYSGTESETEEMGFPTWFSFKKIPYRKKFLSIIPYFNRMWAADGMWMPLVLSGKKIDATFVYKKGMKKVKSFVWEERI